MRERFLLVHLDQERAIDSLPKLLGTDDAAREEALNVLQRILSARGDLSEEGNRRLARIEALFRGKRWRREHRRVRTTEIGTADVDGFANALSR
jgi:hypothetical protein